MRNNILFVLPMSRVVSISLIVVVAFLMVVVPQIASAHESHIYRIGGVDYRFVVGSFGEPISVDDRTGVDFRLNFSDSEDPVEGIDQTLQVEISAADKTKVFDLSPVHGAPGSYKAVYYPTLATTLNYRFFGSINNTPIDLKFTCNPAGHPQKEENTEEVMISDGVTRLMEVGAFGCPVEKAELGFPEPSMSINDIKTRTGGLDGRIAGVASDAGSIKIFGITGVIFGLSGFVIGLIALTKKRKPTL